MLTRLLPSISNTTLSQVMNKTVIPRAYPLSGAQRLVVAQGCAKTLAGYWNGHTLFRAMVTLGLVTDTKPAQLTPLGQAFMAETFLMINASGTESATDDIVYRSMAPQFNPTVVLYLSPEAPQSEYQWVVDTLTACGFAPRCITARSTYQYQLIEKDYLHHSALPVQTPSDRQHKHFLLVDEQYIWDLDEATAELARLHGVEHLVPGTDAHTQLTNSKDLSS